MKNVFFVLTFMFFVNFAYSQQSVVVAGGSQSGVTGEFSYTIGMPIYGMSENEGKAFTIGVQQVFDAIEVMEQTGRDLREEYRETSRGGLANNRKRD